MASAKLPFHFIDLSAQNAINEYHFITDYLMESLFPAGFQVFLNPGPNTPRFGCHLCYTPDSYHEVIRLVWTGCDLKTFSFFFVCWKYIETNRLTSSWIQFLNIHFSVNSFKVFVLVFRRKINRFKFSHKSVHQSSVCWSETVSVEIFLNELNTVYTYLNSHIPVIVFYWIKVENFCLPLNNYEFGI